MNVWSELTTALRTLPRTGPEATQGTLIALCNVWQDLHAVPFLEDMQKEAARKGKEDPYYRHKCTWVRTSRLYFLSRALGDAWGLPIDWSLKTSKQLTEEQAQVCLRWLQGHNPHHWKDSEGQVEEALARNRRYVSIMLYMVEYVLLDLVEEEKAGAVQHSREAVAG